MDSPKHDRLVYYEPCSQRVAHDDARSLARCLETGLGDVPEATLPLEGRAFGDDNTLGLLRRAASGDTPMKEEARAAIEILSGPPKAEAVALVGFLLGGEFTINRAESNLG